MERPDLDALEREMADIRQRVMELEKFLPLPRQPLAPLIVRDSSRFVSAIKDLASAERKVADLTVDDGA